MSYLDNVQKNTNTRYWVNNPSMKECEIAIAQDAFACTTNPAYCAKLFQSDPAYMKEKIAEVMQNSVEGIELAEQVYHATTKDLMQRFLPVYEASGGTKGFVTVQEDPRFEEDHEYILKASLRSKELGPNYMAKIPVTVHGIAVIEQMVKHNVPICATEVFAISQAVEIYRVYEEAVTKYGNRPPLYITHITGIMDQYFRDLVAKEKISISEEALALAGTAVGLKQYRLFKEKGYDAIILGGGARGLEHFTNFVGGDIHITINWSTAEELNATYQQAETFIDREIPAAIIDELLEKLPNFKRSWDENGMTVDEFADYGPVMLFRTQFMNGWSRLIDAVQMAR
ncbi:MAG: transaldolase family protein [Sphaerochaeta sp.]|jgi:transaldolase